MVLLVVAYIPSDPKCTSLVGVYVGPPLLVLKALLDNSFILNNLGASKNAPYESDEGAFLGILVKSPVFTSSLYHSAGLNS